MKRLLFGAAIGATFLGLGWVVLIVAVVLYVLRQDDEPFDVFDEED